MKVYADVQQVASSSGKSWINVESIDSYCGIGVWGVFDNVVLAFRSSFWSLRVFDDEESMNEWWAENVDRYDKLILLSSLIKK